VWLNPFYVMDLAVLRYDELTPEERDAGRRRESAEEMTARHFFGGLGASANSCPD
jgi:hypothetical protein